MIESTFCVLGIDAGGTKTVCYLADGEGRLINQSRGGGANLQAVGELGLEKQLHAVMDEALGPHKIVPVAICLGIAGADRPADAAVVRAIMQRIGLKSRVVVTNDALVALVAGIGHQPGIVIVAGTGSIAYGRNAAGAAARAGGWGYVLGDEGSGYWIGRVALRAVVREADGRGPATLLTPKVLAHFGLSRASDLVHEVYGPGVRPSDIAALARHVQAAWEEGDQVAGAILDQGARELAACAGAVAHQLEMEQGAFAFVLAGGIIKAMPALRAALGTLLGQMAPHAPVVVLEREPAWGAVLLALAEARGENRMPSYRESGFARALVE